MGYLLKKLFCLVLLGFLPGVMGFVLHAEFFSSTLDFSDDELKSGFRLKIPFCELRLAFKDDDLNFGMLATSEKFTKSVPLYLKCGNLSANGLLSKMNSPAVSASAAPFAAPAGTASLIGASLPGHTSFSRPVSLFAQGGLKQKLWAVNVNSWYSPDEEKLAASFGVSANPGKKLKLAFTAGGGFFPYEASDGAVWFFSRPYYAAGSHFCSIVQFSASLPFLKLFFMTGVNESPFGKYVPYYRAETKINTEHFIISGAGFFAGAENTCGTSDVNITASGKTLSPQLQLRGNLQYKSVIKTKRFPVFLKNGVSVYSGLKPAEDSHSLKAGFGSQALFPFMLLQFTVTANLTVNAFLPEYIFNQPDDVTLSFDGTSIQLKNVWYFGNFSPSITASLSSSYGTAISDTYKVGAAVAYAGRSKVKISGSGAFSIILKNGEKEKTKYTATASAAFLWKEIKCTGKLGFEF